ncbi:hypothetical protein ACFLZT_06805, partial [Thermodesulfobacteriota bacterium]
MRSKKALIIFILIGVVSFLYASQCWAATVTWNGSADSSWNNGVNWDGGTVPQTTHDVVITSAGTAPVLDITTTVASLTISGGSLNLNGYTMNVTGNFLTTGSGILTMTTGATDILNVYGNVDFSGGSTDGTLTAGVINVKGAFYGNSYLFSASGSHKVVFNGTAAQTANFSSAGSSGAHFQDAEFANPAGVNFISDAYIAGTATVTNGNVTSDTGRTVTINGDLVDVVGDRWQVYNTDFSGTNPSLPAALITNVRFKGSASLSSGFNLTGNLSVYGSTGDLILNGQTVTVSGNFETTTSGILTMTNALDVLTVDGNVSFNDGSIDVTLTAGVINVKGAFYGNSYFFSASGSHKVVFNGTAAQTANFS